MPTLNSNDGAQGFPEGTSAASTGLFHRFLRIRRGEAGPLFGAAFFHFLLLASYYILRPLREEIGSTHKEALSTLWTMTFVAMLVVVPVYSAVVSVWRRRTALLLVYLFCVLNILVFHILLELPRGAGLAWSEKAFYVWISVFGLLAVSVFWAFMADAFRQEQVTRLFGIIAAGGSLGGLAGSASATILLRYLQRVDLILVAGGLLMAATICLWWLDAVVSTGKPLGNASLGAGAAGMAPRSEAPLSGGILAGLIMVLQSPYLLGICLFLFLHSLATTFIYFEKAHWVDSTFVDRAARAAFFAEVDTLVNTVSVLAQLLLVSRVMKRVGVGVTLMSRPVVTLIGFVLLGVAIVGLPEAGVGGLPAGGVTAVFGVLVTFDVVLRVVNFSLAKPTREVLFTVVDREAKYKSKAFIDTIVYRGSDVVHGWFFAGLANIGLGLGAIAFVAAPFGVAGIVVALFLGRWQERLAKMGNGETRGAGIPMSCIGRRF